METIVEAFLKIINSIITKNSLSFSSKKLRVLDFY